MSGEDIIYIVVTIVIFIVSILGKTKKKAPPVPEIEDEQEYNLNEFEKLLIRREEFAEDMDEQEDEEYDDEEFVKTKNDKKEIDDERKEFVNKKREKAVSKREMGEEEYEDGFDVKSAIIYSSILERKKFRH